jgi:hypothetical protein
MGTRSRSLSIFLGLAFCAQVLTLSACTPKLRIGGAFAKLKGVSSVSSNMLSDQLRYVDYSVSPPKIKIVTAGVERSEDLKLVFVHGKVSTDELREMKMLGFNSIVYYPGFASEADSRAFLEDCLRERIFVVFPPDAKFADLKDHAAILGFYTLDEPEGQLNDSNVRNGYCVTLGIHALNCTSIAVQDVFYQWLKSRSSKPVFVTRADFSDISFRTGYSENAQDVVLLDSYPYSPQLNPSASEAVAVEWLFKVRSQIELNQTGMNKSKLKKAIPVLQGFADESARFGLPTRWTFGEISLYGRAALGFYGADNFGLFVWSYPLSDLSNPGQSEHLIGFGQYREREVAKQYLESYKRFATDLSAQKNIPVEFSSIVGSQLLDVVQEGNLLVSPSSADPDGYGERVYYSGSRKKGTYSAFIVPLSRKDGKNFNRVHASVASLNQYDLTKTRDVRLSISLSTDGVHYTPYYGPTVNSAQGIFHAGFELHQVAIDLPSMGHAFLKIQVYWDDLTTKNLSLTGISVGLQ